MCADRGEHEAVALLIFAPLWHYIEAGVKIMGRVPPLILVATVAASGLEANSGAVITNRETHDKSVLVSLH